MTVALTPALALAYLRELSADYRAGIVLDAAGERLAGPQELTAPARALLATHPQAPEIHGTTARGHAFAARTQTHQIVVATGPFALPRVARLDLRTALSELGPESAQETPPEHLEAPFTNGLLDAAEESFRRHSVN